MIELIILILTSVLLGTFLGIICGIIPALHQNNLAILLLLAFPIYGFVAHICCPEGVYYGFIAMFMAAICTHNFSDILGTVLTGVPDGSELLTLQPAQRLMLKGEGQKIINASVYGSLAGVLLGLVLLLPVKLLISEPVNLYSLAERWISFVLLCVAALIVLSEKRMFEKKGKKLIVLDVGDTCTERSPVRVVHCLIVQLENERKGKVKIGKHIFPFEMKKRLNVRPGEKTILQGIFVPNMEENRWKPTLLALSILLLSGLLGWTVLFTPLSSTSRFTLLFPLFTGLFGVSGLLATIAWPAKLPDQKEEVKWNHRKTNWKVIGGSVTGMLIGIFPGITPGCGAALINTKETKPEQYIAITSAIETSAFIFNIAALFILQKTRSGAIASLEEIYGISNEWTNLTQIPPVLPLCLFAVALAALSAYFVLPRVGILLMRKSKFFVKREFQIGVLIGIITSVILICGLAGILVLLTATLVGLIPILLNLRRIHLMGSIILPVAIVLLI